MTLYTIVGDPHAKPDNLDKINALFDIVEHMGNPTIFLGDTLDTKEVIRGKCLNTIYNRVKNSDLFFIFIIGNHCYFNLECKEHSLEVLKTLKNVLIVDELTYYKNMWFAPYTHDADQFKEWVKQAGQQVLFCHAEIQGFDYGTGLISKEGVEAKDLSNVKKVISGHYHKYQKLSNITYLGTPFSHSFGESNQTKYIGVFDSETQELELIETPFPQHRTIEWNLPNGGVQAYCEGDYVRIILKGTQEEINAVPRHDGVKYIEQPTNLAQTSSVISETDSPEVQFVNWGTDIKGYSDELLTLGLEILTDV